MSYPHFHNKNVDNFFVLLLTNGINAVIIKSLNLKGEDYETNLSTKESSKKQSSWI